MHLESFGPVFKAAKSKRSNIRGKIYGVDVEHGRKKQGHSFDLAQERVLNCRSVF